MNVQYLIRFIVNASLLLVISVLTVQFISVSRKNQVCRMDLAEVNHFRYGLLNVDEWAGQVADVIAGKIQEYDLTPENRGQIRKSLESVMYQLIDDIEEMMLERTSGSFSGIKRWIAGFALDVDQLRDHVPEFARTVMEELDSPETRATLKEFLLEQLQDFNDEAYNQDRAALYNRLREDYGCANARECKTLLEEQIAGFQHYINLSAVVILVMVLLLFLINLLPAKTDHFSIVVLLLTTLSLLLCGVSTPMIELEAKIDRLVFRLLGEDVVFTEQILFFQSKSILNVVAILFQDGSLQMIFVGILIFTFSIVFPSLKLISTYAYHQDLFRLRQNKIIQFFVIKSGKWSMADVMVVALFMAYIGFNGIVSNQLDSMAREGASYDIFTTNGTQLLGGFYLFLFFCLASLVLSEALTRMLKKQA